MKRYQECPWYVRLWRRRYYWQVPIDAVLWWWHERTRPARFVEFDEAECPPEWKGKRFEAPRMGVGFCIGLAQSIAQGRMHWVFTMEEVEAHLELDRAT